MEPKKQDYFVLNPFAKNGSDEELIKYEALELEDIKKSEHKRSVQSEEENLDFQIADDEKSENIYNLDNLNKEIQLFPTIKKYIKNETLTFEIAGKRPKFLYLKLAAAFILFIACIASFIIAVQIIGSFLIGYLVAYLWNYRREVKINISNKILSVGKVQYPLTSINSVAIAQKGEIFYESRIAIDFMSLHLMLETFNSKKEDIVDNSNRKGNDFKLLLEMTSKENVKENKMFVIAEHLNKEEVLILFRELSR